MSRILRLWTISTALEVLLVAVAFWNVVIHEGGWNLTFVIWPGLFVGLFVGVNYHDSFNWIESSITFVVSPLRFGLSFSLPRFRPESPFSLARAGRRLPISNPGHRERTIRAADLNLSSSRLRVAAWSSDTVSSPHCERQAKARRP
jgi:hypothetical protein